MSRKPHERALFQSSEIDAKLIEQARKDHFTEMVMSRHRAASQNGSYRQAGVSGDITKTDTQEYLRRRIISECEGLLTALNKFSTN